ncbi:MAG: amidohydrolase family protein [Anaerolineales bacterium]
MTELLFINATVLTMDEEFHQYTPGAVAVQGDSILAVGFQSDLQARFPNFPTFDCGGKILMPGLVNTHTHVPMTLLRGLADDLRLDVWLLGYVMPTEREFVSPEFVRLGTKIACAELIRSGVTTFADMYYFEDDIAQATAEAGLRGVCGQTVLKFPAPDAASYEESLDYTRKFIQRWKGHPLIVPSIAPHAPYTCTNEILRACAELAVEFDIPLQIHLAETTQEVEGILAEHGSPVIPHVKKQRMFEAKVIAAHCVHVDEGEMLTLKQYKAGVAHNPSSNLKLASGAAPIAKMLELGLNVGIGTDGPASNNDLDMFEEIRLASLLAKGTTGDPTVLPARTALWMATRMGAHALHLGHLIGSLEAGKRADLIIVNLATLHNSPQFHRDPAGRYAQIVYAAKSTDVTDVMVNGEFLMRDHHLLTLDEADLLQQAADYARKVDAFLLQREQSVLSKLVAIEGATEVESFEVQIKAPIANPQHILETIQSTEIEILRYRRYHEFDTYFGFDDPAQGLLRYREDEFISETGQIEKVRYRLTAVGPNREAQFESDVVLSRSRYLAPATHSLRFYREYFKPTTETEIEKDRRRWRVLFKGTEFYINLDEIRKPALGHFVEIKSRTWSRRDAEHKAALAAELLRFLGANPEEATTQDYIQALQ